MQKSEREKERECENGNGANGSSVTLQNDQLISICLCVCNVYARVNIQNRNIKHHRVRRDRTNGNDKYQIPYEFYDIQRLYLK